MKQVPMALMLMASAVTAETPDKEVRLRMMHSATQAALDKGELEAVTESLARADALIERFAKQIGGA